MSVRSGSPCTSTSMPIFSCSLMAYSMYSLTFFSYSASESWPFFHCSLARRISAQPGLDVS